MGQMPLHLGQVVLLALLTSIFLVGGDLPTAHAQPDLILDGASLSLSGIHTFDNVSIVNGSTLFVDAFDGTNGGKLTIKATSIVVDSTSSIVADGRGFRGIVNSSGEGPGGGEGGGTVFDGGGGGGYGGQGGNGVRDFFSTIPDGAGGPANGSATAQAAQKGSAGGSAGTADGDFGGTGGNGGGAVCLEADTITIAGTVAANGGDGMIYINDSSGGGAGGGILLLGETVTVSASALLRANGGSGGTACGQLPCVLDDGGGGGGGGRIKVFYFKQLDLQGTTSVNGGAGAGTAVNGQDGTVHTERLNRAPDCGNAAPSLATLWPPNHKFVPVTITGVTDPDGDPITITIDSIRQDEPVNAKGQGAGNTSPDGMGVGTETASVRAERSGTKKVPGDGRVYHITFTADDGDGGTCTETVTVCVPHDQRPGHVCVDGGPLFDSTSP